MKLNPTQVAALKKQLAQGQMPPNVAALHPHMAPPGAVDLGGVGPAIQGQHPSMSSKAAQNPIPPGDEGIAVIRGLSECNIPPEAAKLHGMMNTVLKLNTDTMTDEIVEATDRALADGVLIGITANRHCKKNLHKRPVVHFDKDDELRTIHNNFRATEDKIMQLKKDHNEAVEKAQHLLRERWKMACKKNGLDPENKFYQIDDEAGIIYDTELRCDNCKGSKDIRKARQKAEELVSRYEHNNKETSDDGKSKTQT